MLWVGIGASALLLFILVCLALFVVVRAGVLSALRAHAREERRRVRTGAIDLVARQADPLPRTNAISKHAAPDQAAAPLHAAS